MRFRAHHAKSLRKARLHNEIFFLLQPLFLQKDVAESGEARKVTRSLVTVERMSRIETHIGVGH